MLLLVVLAGALLVPSLAGAAVEKGLFFDESDEITIAWADLKKEEVEAGLCNAGSKPVTGLQARLVGFGFKAKDKTNPEVLRVGVPARLGSGDCAKVTIAAGDEPTSAAFAGDLLVTSAGAGAVRRALTLSGPDYLPPGTLKATRDKTPFTASRGPLQDAELKGDNLSLREADPETAPAKLLEKGEFVGHVYKDGFEATVRIAGAPSTVENGQFSVPIKVEGADHVGTYSGSLDLTGKTKEADRVDITIAVKDAWGWAVAAIVLGVILGLVPVLCRRCRVVDGLEERRDALADKYEKAEAELRRTDAPKDLRAPALDSKLGAFVDDFDKSFTTYRKGALALDRKDKGYVRLDGKIGDAESDAETMGDRSGGLGPALGALREHLTELDEFLDSENWSKYPPAFRKSAWPLLAGGELPVGGSVALKKKATKYSDLIERWTDLARQVSRIEEWAAALMLQGDISARDQGLLASARSAGAEAHEQLLRVTVASGIPSGTAAEVNRAHGTLTYLAERYPGRTDREELDFAFGSQQLNVIGEIRRARRCFLGESKEDLLKPGLPHLPEPARAAMRKGWRSVLDAGAVVAALAVAIVTALSSFYFGEAWGTTVDYLTVIVIGTGSQVVLKALTDSLASLGNGEAEETEEEDEEDEEDEDPSSAAEAPAMAKA